jgi:putative chitinase
MIELTEGDLRAVFPHARDSYLEAILNERDFLEEYGVLDSALRWCHFCGQIGAETDGLRIVRENMKYSPTRIVEVFGPQRHSAKVGYAEAKTLAYNGYKLAERVYGLGNPSMAGRLGNTEHGDGYNYRGWGPGQVTGKGQSLKYGDMLSLDLATKPELLEDAAVGLKAFVLEWDHRSLNKWADSNQILAVSRGVNLGNPRHSAMPNGYANRKQWFSKAWSHWRMADVDGDAIPAAADTSTSGMILRRGDSGSQVLILQKRLKELNYAVGWTDGIFGRRTDNAVTAFQKDQGIEPDGIVGPITWAKLRDAERIDDIEREEVTAEELLARGSRQIENAGKTQALGLTTGVGGGIALGGGLAFPQTIASVPVWIASVRTFSDDLNDGLAWASTAQGLVTIIGICGLVFGWRIWKRGLKAIETRVDEARSGANLDK